MAAIRALVPVRWVLLHRDGLPARVRPEWTAALDASLRRVGEFGDAVLYEVPPAPGAAPDGDRHGDARGGADGAGNRDGTGAPSACWQTTGAEIKTSGACTWSRSTGEI
jgi:hypothetical protein